MSRTISICLVAATTFCHAICVEEQPIHHEYSYSSYEIKGGATNGLQANFDINHSGEGWEIDILLTAQTNFSGHTWLLTTNAYGSRLNLWLTNGSEEMAINPSVNESFNVSQQTTASEILDFHPSRGRVYQWWLVGRPVTQGVSHELAHFKLESAFALSATNDYVLEITPLVYRVETNEVTADLVAFPPTKITLQANGQAKMN